MKCKLLEQMKKIVAVSLLCMLCISDVTYIYADNDSETVEEEAVAPENVIELSTAADLLAFAENCKLDAFSIGKRVELKNDISLFGVEFSGIPYFNGIFDGNGYKISNVNIKEKGSQYGFFRYIGDLGLVSDLNLSGMIAPTGSQEEIGAIAGVNYGIIQNCGFTGTVYGVNSVGAIAGLNSSTGRIIGCHTKAVVLATDNTGGIAGVNHGVIDSCVSECAINNEELETEMDLGGIDIGTMNFTQTVVNRNNMGGIAGNSTGVIQDSLNKGTIGYAHAGYNVGGIAGCQSGIIINCTNEGTIYGRKDVGGIVGQAAPYVQSEYLSEQLEHTKNDLNRMNRTLNSMSYNLEKNAKEAQVYADALAVQFESTSGSLADRLDQMENAVPKENEEAQQCMDNINAAMDKIEAIQNKEGNLTAEDIAEIEKQMQIIEENTARLEEINRQENGTIEDNLSGNASGNQTSNRNAQGLSDSIQKSVDTLTNGINSLTNQTENIIDDIYDNTAVIRGEKSYIVDISSIKTAAELDGVISRCINKGTIESDLNTGGIAGTMNIEYGDDSESDFGVDSGADIATSSEVNDVIIDSINYGTINGKKNYTGSVVGLQAFGYLYQCEGYGHVNASAGSYVGGIAGMSNGKIEKCYAMLDISGKDYVGGIAGYGSAIKDSISIITIAAEGERIGGIAGFIEDIGKVSGNLFVKEGYDGIDNISYLGVAEPTSYEAIMQLEGMPEGFNVVQVAFEVEEEILCETTVAYGSSLTKADFPEVPEKDGYYIVWPEKSVYTDICNNLTVEAEYVPWTQSIATGTDTLGKPLFIAVGEFYEGTQLHILEEEVEFVMPSERMNLLYSHEWTILSETEKKFDKVEGHFYVPYSPKGVIQVWVKTDAGWETVDTGMDGSYVVAEIPYEAAFAIVELQLDNSGLYMAVGAGILVLILVISGIIVHNKRKKNVK